MPPKIFNSLKTTLDKKNAEKVRLNMQKYAAHVRIYANFWICIICGIIFAYVILKMLLYAEKYAIYADFGKICARICDHIFAYNQHP